MKKSLKRTAGILIGATLALSVLGMTACGGTPSSDYDGIGKEYIVTHADGKVRYTFEAENTNLSNKFGTASSGEYKEEAMLTPASDASNGYAVNGLCKKGLSVNFIIVSDRDVSNATLILRLGAELNMNLTFDADMFQIRVDPVHEADLDDYRDGGAWGMWDSEFLDVYGDVLPFEGYYVDEYACEDITVEATSQLVSGFEDYVVYTKLKLTKGVNCISLITNNEVRPGGSENATMFATAPIVDCIKIETTAQLGMYMPVNNMSIGTSKACTYVSI